MRMMPYSQVIKLAGAPGVKVGEDPGTAAPIERWHWDGGNGTFLNVRVAAGKVVDANVLAPNGHVYSLEKSGEIIDAGK